MPDVLVLEFSKPDAVEIYHEANRRIGVDPTDGSGGWPDGMVSRVAGAAGDKLIVVEVWESQGRQEAFMQDRLVPAVAQANVLPPSRVEWCARRREAQRLTLTRQRQRRLPGGRAHPPPPTRRRGVAHRPERGTWGRCATRSVGATARRLW
jgi:hypothetical protein